MAQDGLPDALLRGEKAAWDAFVRRYGGLVVAAVRGVASVYGDVEDLTQDVFVRLCKDDFRLLRSYDPGRASLSTWITIVARSTARDGLRRRRRSSDKFRSATLAAGGCVVAIFSSAVCALFHLPCPVALRRTAAAWNVAPSARTVSAERRQEQNCATRLYGTMFRKPAFLNPR